jgi:hypothetical protein
MKFDKIFFIGLIFLFFGISAIVNTLLHLDEGLAPILWFSYIGLILLSIGCFARNSSLIASQLCIIFVPYLIWNVDFISYLFFGSSIWGTVDYIFATGDLFGKIISLQHVFNIPLSLYSIYLLGLRIKDFWKISIFEISMLFFVSRLFTNYEQNVNCVYHNCATFDFGIWYPLQWFLAYAVMIGLTRLILVRLFYKK